MLERREGVPHTIVNSALKVLNDTDIGRDDNDERATALRDELTKSLVHSGTW